MKHLVLLLLLISPPLAHAQTTLQTATATLTWDSNTESDMDSYIMLIGSTSGVYGSTRPVVHVQGVPKQTGKFTGLDEGKVYYFAVKACDTSGNCSDLSQEVSGGVTIPPNSPSGLSVTFEINIEVTIP